MTLSDDDNWMRPPSVQCREEIAIYREMFSLIHRDLKRLKTGQPVLVEGAALLPGVMDEHRIRPDRYVCVVPTRDFQFREYRKRPWIADVLRHCTHPEQAFANWMERDALFAEQVSRQAGSLGYQVIRVDGSQSPEIIADQIGRLFSLA